MSSSKVLEVKSISVATDEIIDYIRSRKLGTSSSLKTRWNKLNSQCMGGIEPNTIYTVVGISGSGKSSFVNTLETDLVDLNPEEDLIVLNFSLEMLSSKQIGRKLSCKMRQTTSELYSSVKPITDASYSAILKASKGFKEYPIYYVDTPGSVAEIEATIMNFYNTKVLPENAKFIVILDHTLLVDGSGSVLETIAALQKMFIKVKKLKNTSVIQLSQMNRNIEGSERINNNSMHYPMRSDISSADSIYQASDYVLCIHRPELLNIKEYGPNRLPIQDMIYIHILKNRDAGSSVILQYKNDLKYNNLVEC